MNQEIENLSLECTKKAEVQKLSTSLKKWEKPCLISIDVTRTNFGGGCGIDCFGGLAS